MLKKSRIILLSYLGQALLNFLFRTNRMVVDGAEYIEDARKSGRPIMLCSWHGRVVYGSYWIKKAKLKPWTIASLHGDGEILGLIVQRWGYKLIRGSSTRGGSAVLRKLHSVFSSDDNMVAITNDGPRGPERIAKPGSVSLALKFNAQIIAVTGTSSRYWEFGSWDSFRIPKPFGTVHIRVGVPLEIPTDVKITPEDESKLVSDYINAVQDKCDQS